ncbi:ABC transporter ATP-binding protein [Spiribacter vilamensis]|uniref:Iron complex transport system ATP-binding protein n=1 Tax=Spiribacter vilamensis TaxID=531306 RepID=A0A4V2GJC4_9GAMM|nr:ABC transporter ATP-binding protein [Spiribacter vilamensis]RZU99335.1 iron complex transport system ATP-binding protein [Spiribacter vilamensis]TVO61681.1 ABC transporter ATP-binding protein [Spiribacter vilamensis]
MTRVTFRDFSVALAGTPVIGDINLSIEPGELVGLIGPNGAGKTTLMRAALGLIPASGHCSLAGLDDRTRARTVAWMPQDRSVAWPISVEALVMLGRMPHRAPGQRPGRSDLEQVAKAIREVGLAGFEHRAVTRLSAGERTRALIARSLAQQTPMIMADEPIAGLDPAHQITTMETFAGIAASGRSVLVSLHDLGLAARHCTRLILVGERRIVADGAPAAVLTADNLARIFHIEAFLQATDHGPVFQSLRVLGP